MQSFFEMSSHNHYSPFLARIYDKVLHIPIRNIRRSVAEEIKNEGAIEVIDLCCGTGNQITYLREAGIVQAVGVDVSENMLHQAWRNGLKNVCLKMDASATTFDNDTFDAAIMSFSLHEMAADTAKGVFMESKRIVKPGGLLIVVDYCFDNHTRPLGRFAARAVEKFVGGDHYRNFKYFMAEDLLAKFSDGLSIREKRRFLFGAVGMWVYVNS
ncbi:MAG: class I SAM-dependent methyltransferase [Bacteroidetes bacterium]|nr:MAG: class I SAM-dependent methyltransferase [Bacteroidota bacterium]